MSANAFAIGLCGLTIAVSTPVFAQQSPVVPSDDRTRALVGQLDLERYKATIRGLGQFGDRQQGTDRNRAAVDCGRGAAAKLRLHHGAHQICL